MGPKISLIHLSFFKINDDVFVYFTRNFDLLKVQTVVLIVISFINFCELGINCIKINLLFLSSARKYRVTKFFHSQNIIGSQN